MPSEIFYTDGKGAVHDLHDEDSAFLLKIAGVHSRAWTRTLMARGARNIANVTREVSIQYLAADGTADTIRRAFDSDLANGTPGTFTYQGWNMRCYIAEESTQARYYGWVKRQAALILLDAYWWKERSKHFTAGLASGGIDHDYDHIYDLSYAAGNGSVEVETSLGALPRITFYGPCANPYVTIGGNRYEVDVNVPSGSKIVLDATGSSPSVMMIDSQGVKASKFANAVRTGGSGGGSYAFEPLPGGTFEVTWSGSFAFDLAWRERETEPPWAS